MCNFDQPANTAAKELLPVFRNGQTIRHKRAESNSYWAIVIRYISHYPSQMHSTFSEEVFWSGPQAVHQSGILWMANNETKQIISANLSNRPILSSINNIRLAFLLLVNYLYKLKKLPGFMAIVLKLDADICVSMSKNCSIPNFIVQSLGQNIFIGQIHPSTFSKMLSKLKTKKQTLV